MALMEPVGDAGKDFICRSGVAEEADDLRRKRLRVTNHVAETGQIKVHPRKSEYVLRHCPVVDAPFHRDVAIHELAVPVGQQEHVAAPDVHDLVALVVVPGGRARIGLSGLQGKSFRVVQVGKLAV